MAAGIKIYNDAGTIQVDENYFNLALIKKETVNSFVPPIGGPTYSTVFYGVNGVAGETPIVAVSCSRHAVVSAAAWNTPSFPNQWAVTVMIEGAVSVPCTIYTFGRTQTPPPTFGLIVRNAAGQVVFHTSEKYMRLTDVVDMTSAGAGNRVYTAGRQYAWATQFAGYYSKTIPASRLQWGWMGCAINGGNTASFSQINYAISAGSFPSGVDRSSGLIIDVTSY